MTTPEQAREIAQHLFFPNGDNGYALRSLAEQVETLTAERDEWKARCEFSFGQRDKLTAERDALKDAARLALVALEGVVDFDPDSKAQWSVSGGAYEAHECNSAGHRSTEGGAMSLPPPFNNNVCPDRIGPEGEKNDNKRNT